MTEILFIDDELEKQKIFKLRLESLGYNVRTVSSGERAFALLETEKFDLILLDIFMPGMDGFEVLKIIRSKHKTRNIPIVMLTSSTSEKDEVKSIELGADDFLSKDANKEIIQVRIKNTLRKHQLMLGLNPLTGLPGNLQIEENISERIRLNQSFAIGYADLDHFKEFNDHFGFQKGDSAIRLASTIINNGIESLGNPTDFLGHVGGDDFIFITKPENIKSICQFICKQADELFPQQYPDKIREKGYIMAKNRKGEVSRIELLTISIAVVSNQFRQFTSPSEIASIASEVKKKAKSIPGNSYYLDKRRF